jgi:hypothetical protein
MPAEESPSERSGALPGHYLYIAVAENEGDMDGATKTLSALLRLQSDLSIAWMIEVMPWAGELGERLVEGLRQAEVPEA